MPERLPGYDNWKLSHDERVEGDEEHEVEPLNHVFGTLVRKMQREDPNGTLVKIFGREIKVGDGAH